MNLATASRGSGRGIVILGVLVILTISALIGTTVLFLASAERASTETSLRRTQARALAWSGLQAVMAELSVQREDILAGADPVITAEWTLFGEDEPLAGIYRIVPLSDGFPLVSESAKIDVNRAPATVLEALPGVDGALAAAIIEARPFASIEELVRVEGITYERLYGGPESIGDGYDFGGAVGAAADPTADSSAISGAPLKDLLTTFSFDPNIQRGLGPDGRDSAGDLRINLNVPWSDRLGRAIERRYDEDAANAVRMIMNRGTQFDSDAALIGVLNEFDVPEDEWPRVLDVFTTSPDPYLLGRVDVNRASRDVLACLPAIGQDRAEDVISQRQGLDEQTLGSTAWLASEGVVPRDEFGQCADWVTTRSMQWRVRIEAGFLEQDRAEIAFGSAEGAAGSSGGSPADRSDFGSPFEAEPRLRDKVVLEAVIDISSTRPRVAYLRDVSLMPVAEAIYFELDSGEIEQGATGRLGSADRSGVGPGERPEMLDTEGFDPFADDPVGGDGSGETRSSSSGRGAATSGRASGRGSGAENGGETGAPPDDNDEAGRSAGDVPEVGPDRRLGRWTSRTNGQGDGQ